MSEHSFLTTGNLDFYSNNNNLISVKMNIYFKRLYTIIISTIDTDLVFSSSFCKISTYFFSPMSFLGWNFSKVNRFALMITVHEL